MKPNFGRDLEEMAYERMRKIIRPLLVNGYGFTDSKDRATQLEYKREFENECRKQGKNEIEVRVGRKYLGIYRSEARDAVENSADAQR